jgi:hypothetical protein
VSRDADARWRRAMLAGALACFAVHAPVGLAEAQVAVEDPTELELALTAGEPWISLRLTASHPGTVFELEMPALVRRPGQEVPSLSDRLCVAPCEVELPAGTHRLRTASTARGWPEVGYQDVQLDRGAGIHAELVDRDGPRIALLVGGVLGILAGTVVALAAPLGGEEGVVVGASVGLGLGLAGFALGIAGLIWEDGIELSVTPSPSDGPTHAHR